MIHKYWCGDSKREYIFDSEKGTTTWLWNVQKSDDGKEYMYNSITKETCWVTNANAHLIGRSTKAENLSTSFTPKNGVDTGYYTPGPDDTICTTPEGRKYVFNKITKKTAWLDAPISYLRSEAPQTSSTENLINTNECQYFSSFALSSENRQKKFSKLHNNILTKNSTPNQVLSYIDTGTQDINEPNKIDSKPPRISDDMINVTVTVIERDIKASVKNMNSFPPQVKSYIRRSIVAAGEDEQLQKDVMKQLKHQIGQVILSGKLKKIKWDSLPLADGSIKRDELHISKQTEYREIKKQMRKRKFELQSNADGEADSGPKKSKTDIEDAPPRSPKFYRETLSELGPSVKPKLAATKELYAMMKTAGFSEGSYDSFHFPLMMKSEEAFVTGVCEDLEKQYLRLTSKADPSKVRPKPILIEAFRMVKSKIKSGERSYGYAVEQLKSIRQDMKVQGIKDDFAIKVYESHARIALEEKDIGEFNQCLTQLGELYEEVEFCKNRDEFTAYRILYTIYSDSQEGYRTIRKKLTAQQLASRSIKYAIQIYNAVLTDNYVRFFKLYSKAPHMLHHLMRLFIPRVRSKAVKMFCRAYRGQGTVELSMVEDLLAFEETESCTKYLLSIGAVLTEDGTAMDITRSDIQVLSFSAAITAMGGDQQNRETE